MSGAKIMYNCSVSGFWIYFYLMYKIVSRLLYFFFGLASLLFILLFVMLLWRFVSSDHLNFICLCVSYKELCFKKKRTLLQNLQSLCPLDQHCNVTA